MNRITKSILPVLVPAGIILALALGVILIRKSAQTETKNDAFAKARPVQTRRLEGNRWKVSLFEKEAYLKDLAGVTKQIIMKPHPGKEDNSVTYLSIFKIAEDSPMYAAGFRKDDHVLRVNGTPIGTMGRAINLVHEIKACNRLTVQVGRGDQIIDYQFDFE